MAKSLLIVDDNRLSLRLAHDLLEAYGYAVETAENGVTALAKLRERLPDLLLLDIGMPGMSGFDVVRAIRREPALMHLPVIAMTAFAMQSDRAACLAAGCDAYISKPFDLRHLLDLVRRHVLRMPTPAARRGMSPLLS